MCGIVAALAFGKLPKEKEKARQILLRLLTTELLLETEERGKDATGAAILFDDGRFFGIKRGEEVGDFMALFGESPDCFGSFLKIWREHGEHALSRVYLGHCRQLTKGDKDDNSNNHPIKVGNIVGIHNGVIRNDEVIFHNLQCERDGKVDSEAVLRLLAHGTNGGKDPFTLPVIQDVIRRMDGQFAVAAFNADNPYQVPMFRDGRPIEFTIVQSMQLVFACSEKKFWDTVLFRYERIVTYYNEMLKQNIIPSLLEKDNIRTESLEDDSAIIFDLEAEIRDETKIKDLGDWSKMERGKVWLTMPTAEKTAATTSAHTPIGTAGYFGGGNNFAEHNKPATVTEKPKEKRRFFDKLLKRYVVKMGDQILKDEESIVLPVDKQATTEAAKVDVTAEKMVQEQENEIDESRLIDLSCYVESLSDGADVIEVDPRDITVVSNVPEGEDEATTVEVKMKSIPPEIFSASISAYETLPVEEKGYESLSDAVVALDIKDLDTAVKLPVLVLINKTFKEAFRKGYVNCALKPTTLVEKEDAKKERQEEYIRALKAMIIIMALFYKKVPYSFKENTAQNSIAYKESVLAHIASESASPRITSSQLELLQNLLNLYEQNIVAPVAAAISAAITEEENEEKSNEIGSNSAAI